MNHNLPETPKEEEETQTNNDKTKLTYETTDVRKRTAAEKSLDFFFISVLLYLCFFIISFNVVCMFADK